MINKALLVLLPTLLLGGCGGMQANLLDPAPVTDLEAGGGATNDASAPVSANNATNTLLAQADRQRAAGNLESAAASLERALRIEPRNAWLWHHLAKVRLDQGKYDLAANLAAKSNSLAAGDQELIEKNRALIRQARQSGRG